MNTLRLIHFAFASTSGDIQPAICLLARDAENWVTPNPVVHTEKVVRSFLRYQLTAYPFADKRLHAQMRKFLSLIAEGLFHAYSRQRIPAEIEYLYGHQEDLGREMA